MFSSEDGRWKKIKEGKESQIDGDRDREIKCRHIYKGNIYKTRHRDTKVQGQKKTRDKERYRERHFHGETFLIKCVYRYSSLKRVKNELYF